MEDLSRIFITDGLLKKMAITLPALALLLYLNWLGL